MFSAEQRHQRDHRRARRQERPPVAAVMEFARDVGDGQHVRQRDAEQPRIFAHARRHVRHVKQRGHRQRHGANHEEDDAVHRPAAQFVVERAFGFHHAVNRAVHHEQRHGRDADQQRIRLQQAEKRPGEFAVGVNRHAPGDVAQRHADEQAPTRCCRRKSRCPTSAATSASAVCCEIQWPRRGKSATPAAGSNAR